MTAPTFAVERTALAWRRTAVACMGTAALFLNHAVSNGWRGASAAPVVAALTLTALAFIAMRRNQILLHGQIRDSALPIAAVTLMVVGVALVAAAIGLTDPVAV
ncbi:DUF202 domain-containing protein [Nocardia sp. ET3-3]|uniref:DUF202 domain-containing protein n=1 Tax=Nocardia terrae TaxID=2675851 RepID=A0A7K1USB3_9NOCA|nr:DUF202 domain-containing protein [Nocardia terrae]MVU77224.1 DUF202 domain-containing protein [Nocardia terrae]